MGTGRAEYLQPQGVMVVGVLVQALVVGRVVALLVELTTQTHPSAHTQHNNMRAKGDGCAYEGSVGRIADAVRRVSATSRTGGTSLITGIKCSRSRLKFAVT
jgi:hypothetical protein